MHFITEYGLFLAKTITLLLAIVIGFAGILAIASRGKDKNKGRIKVTKLNKKFADMAKALHHAMADKNMLKSLAKEEKKQHKKPKDRKRLFVIHFKGDIKASQVKNLREEITAVLNVAKKEDEVMVTVESGGGMVHGYGLAASQLQRIRDKQIPLTVIIDKVAASGGYLMASVANKIFAAPFAIIGSIGVIGQLPNFNRLLKHNYIDYEQMTAGEFKRTLTVFGENTDKAREKFREELEETHQLFKSYVAEHREKLDIDKVATGEYWYGRKALELGLVDSLQTSDDYLLTASDSCDIYQVRFTGKKNITAKLAENMHQGVQTLLHLFRQGYSNIV